jgi:hypothetical protein
MRNSALHREARCACTSWGVVAMAGLQSAHSALGTETECVPAPLQGGAAGAVRALPGAQQQRDAGRRGAAGARA